MAKPHLKLITPAIENRTVTTPRRKPNAELRTREYLTEAEVERLIETVKGNRYGHRDATMILVAYRHGLRVSELVDLRWDQIDFNKPPPCTSAGSSRAPLRRIQSWATNCAHCAGCSGSRSPGLPFVFTSERRLALHHSWLCQTGGTRWCGRWPGLPSPPAYAAARLRLHAGQQRHGYQDAPGLSWPQEHPAHGALHRTGTGSVQGHLALNKI